MTNKVPYDASEAFTIGIDEQNLFGRKIKILINGNVRRFTLIDATYHHEPCRSCDGTGKADDNPGILDGACQTCAGNRGTGKTTLTLEIDHLIPPREDV